jgi:NitT/TauT family transport system substrate-binding protein
LQAALKINLTVFSGETLYTEAICLVAPQEYVQKNPVVVKKIMQALLKAETFVQQHPEEARRIVAKFIKTDQTILDETWNNFTFQLLLDQALLVNLENQTRWAIKNRLTMRREMPNYLDFIYVDGLQAVKPDAVRIIR